MALKNPPSRPLRRVLCVVPPTGKIVREDRCQTPIEKFKTMALLPPIDLLYAASSFESAGAEVRVVDYPAENLGWADLERCLADFRPGAIVLSVTTPSLERDMEAAALAKRVDPDILTVAKGAHFTTLDVATLELFPALDMVLRGEYEMACMELGRGVASDAILGITWRDGEGRVQRNPDRPFTDNIDAIPFPARHLANNALYVRPDTGQMLTTLVTNRGCPFHCIYCLANQVSGTKNRYRSVENVVDEIRDCVERHGIRNFLFRSDLFPQNKAWVIRLCKAIIGAGLDIEWACNSRVDTLNAEVLGWMKKAGCWLIAFGVESGDQETLDRIEKKARVEDAFTAIRLVREAGIKSSVYLLMGLPWETLELNDRQIAFAKELDPDFLETFYVYPFPGTPLYDLAVKEGLIKEGDIPREAYSDPAMPSLYLSIEELKHLRHRALRQYYLRPKVIARTLRGARSPKEAFNYIRAGFEQLKDFWRYRRKKVPPAVTGREGGSDRG